MLTAFELETSHSAKKCLVFSFFLAQTTTIAPRELNLSAIAAPMPLVPPVTIATLPLKIFLFFYLNLLYNAEKNQPTKAPTTNTVTMPKTKGPKLKGCRV